MIELYKLPPYFQMGKDKKKLLIFIPEFPVLTETFIQQEITQLVKCGHFDIRIFVLRKGDVSLDPEVEKAIYCKKLNAFTSFIGFFYFLKIVFTKFPRVLSLYRDLKDKKVSIVRKLYVMSKAIGFYTEEFSKLDPDIIYAHFMSEPSTNVLIASELLNKPFGISAHAKDIFVGGEYISQKVSRAKFITVCNKKAYKSVLTKSGKKEPKNIHLIYHGKDFNKLMSIKYKKMKKEVPLILSNSRFTEKKGHTYLLQASSLLKKSGFKHKICLIGSGGELLTNVFSQIRTLGLEDTVEIVNKGKGIPLDEVVTYYRNADLFVFSGINTPSGDMDGVPNVLVEAAIFKIPIITTDSGSVLDFIEPGKTGLVVKQKDPKGIADSIEKIVNDNELKKRLVNNGLSRAKQMFDIKKSISLIEKLISS